MSVEEKLLRYLDREALASLARDLVRMPSVNPPGDEKQVAEFIADRLKSGGFEVDIYDVYPQRPNVTATLKGAEEGPTLLFNGHTDVVPVGSGWTTEPFKADVRNGRIYGRGSADMKGGLASMIVAMEALKETGIELRGNLVFSAVVDEEATGNGTRSLIERGLKSDFAIIGEPTGLSIAIAHKGSVWFKITTHGKTVHSSMPHKGINAIYKMVRVINSLEDLSNKLQREAHPLLGPPTLSVGKITGGTKPNIVPEDCEIVVDRRLIPGETIGKVRAEFDELISAIKKEDEEFQADIEVIPGVVGPAEIPQNEPIVKALMSSTKKVIGRSIITGFTASCDAYYLIKQGRIPTAIFGPGEINQAHVADEYVEIAQLMAAAKIYALTAYELLKY